MPTLIGTAHFVNRRAALDYYRPYNESGTNPKEVTRKEKEGEISYGPPEISDGESLTVREGRYHIVSTVPRRRAKGPRPTGN